MALGDPYATLAELKDYLSIPSSKTSLDAALVDALNSASREIERICNRQFNLDSGTTARIYEPLTFRLIYVDDFANTTGLVVETDPGGTGTFTSTWTSFDYELAPFNQIVSGQAGWPYNQIKSVGGQFFPRFNNIPFRRRATVRVTAQYGWPSVPQPVRQACLIMASETFKLKDTPFGVAGMSQFGAPIRVRDNPMAASKLQPYIYRPLLVG